MVSVLLFFFFFSSRRRHTRCALVTGVQTCALPISAAIDEDVVREIAGHDIERRDVVGWDRRAGDVVARQEERFGAIVLVERPLDDVPAAALGSALLEGLRAEGTDLLGWDDDDRGLQQRLGFLHRLDPDRWPDVSDAALLAEAEERVLPLLRSEEHTSELQSLIRNSSSVLCL